MGVNGMSTPRTPTEPSASIMALVMAAGAPMVPDSPQPLTPEGLWVQGWVSSVAVMKSGSTSARGMA